MKPELKVTSQPLSARMKELGWDYETERYWTNWYYEKGIVDFYLKSDTYAKETYRIWKDKQAVILPDYLMFPAPDAIEIELPYRIENDGKWYDLWIIKHTDNSWIVSYTRDTERKTLKSFNDKNLSEAFGKMWCYLKERG